MTTAASRQPCHQARLSPSPSGSRNTASNESNSFCSDDILTFLEDNSGLSLVNATNSIAVGRIPARSAQSAEIFCAAA
ncbi:C25 family cysteine peptidase [Duncaniella muris]|uniref:C25 family cysteine peptidase n=1 Tax=Duncaniella muris TaxID=2094150 RepID=UPI003F66493C